MKFQVRLQSKGFLLQTVTCSLSLNIEQDGELKLVDKAESDSKEALFADALIGIAKGRKESQFARLVEKIQCLPFPSNGKETDQDRYYREHLERALTNTPFLYFSDNYDLTRTFQQGNKRSFNEKEIFKPNGSFIWNLKLIQPLLEAQVSSNWIHPIIQGCISFKENIRVLDLKFDLLLISRRSIKHQGTRFNCRGLNSEGHAANFCETEQVIQCDNDSVCSFVQVRGSVPTLWGQKHGVSPRIIFPNSNSNSTTNDPHFDLFLKHYRDQLKGNYGDKITFLNLIDKKGHSNSSKDQSKLGTIFEVHMKKLVELPEGANCKFIWYDFHHETKTGWHNLKGLVEISTKNLMENEFFCNIQEKPSKTQKGYFRVNCMDNLDRTNVVQSILGRMVALKQIEFLLGRPLSVTQEDNVFDSGLVEFETAFKNIWADNADAISLVYAGSAALKTDFTRTGKRTPSGPYNDAMNSTIRFFLNTFLDCYRQNEFDVLLQDDSLIHTQLLKGKLQQQFWTYQKRIALLAIVGFSSVFVPTTTNGRLSSFFLFLITFSWVAYKQSREKPAFSRNSHQLKKKN